MQVVSIVDVWESWIVLGPGVIEDLKVRLAGGTGGTAAVEKSAAEAMDRAIKEELEREEVERSANPIVAVVQSGFKTAFQPAAFHETRSPSPIVVVPPITLKEEMVEDVDGQAIEPAAEEEEEDVDGEEMDGEPICVAPLPVTPIDVVVSVAGEQAMDLIDSEDEDNMFS